MVCSAILHDICRMSRGSPLTSHLTKTAAQKLRIRPLGYGLLAPDGIATTVAIEKEKSSSSWSPTSYWLNQPSWNIWIKTVIFPQFLRWKFPKLFELPPPSLQKCQRVRGYVSVPRRGVFLHETDLRKMPPQKEGSCSIHQFAGAFAVSFREGIPTGDILHEF